MRKRLLCSAIVLVMLLGNTPSVRAGGWAAVHLVGDLAPAYQEVPWTVNFLVKQHDVTPVNVDRAFLSATHRSSGQTITADATQIGDMGNYSVTVVFPLAGEWKWSITPEPFSGSSFATLTVLARADSAAKDNPIASYPAHLHAGICASPGDVVFPLPTVATSMTTDGTPTADPTTSTLPSLSVANTSTTIDTPLSSLLDSPHAIDIHTSDVDTATGIACGEIAGPTTDGQLLIAIQPLNDSGVTGIAVLGEAGNQTTVSIYLLEPRVASASTSAASASSPVEILMAGDSSSTWQFTPARLDITIGTTVVWSNVSNVPHTVSAPNLDFDDSGYIDTGESFQQTFDTPGSYAFYCDPHPWMTGVIEVSR